MKPKIIIRDRVYIPINTITHLEQVKTRYTRHIFKESNCLPCEYKPERPCATCESCPNYQGVVKLWKFKTIGSTDYLGLPIGDKALIEKKAGIFFEDYRIVDKRNTQPLMPGIKFTIELRPHQKKLVREFMRKKYGLIEAPPRTGKTALMLYLGIKLGQRMLLVANQHEYLQQFLWHIEGNEEEGIPKCTNLPELQRKLGKKLYGFPKKDSDFKTMQFMVLTYQQFLSEIKGKNRLKIAAGAAGTVAVDEAHKVGASTFASVLNSFHTKFRFGVTGTVTRKDGRHRITKMVLGPIVARTTVEATVPKVFIKDTGIKLKRDPKLWVFKMKALADNKERNKIIVNRAIKDVKNGHSVVIPLVFTKHIRQIVADINEAYGKPIAEAFTGGGSDKQKELRRQILARAKSGETRVTVGTRQLLQLGLNVPRWSAIYTVIPISNEPNYKQETSRVRTPMDGKRQPIVRLYYDSAMPASIACARNCVNHMRNFKYEFSTDEHTKTSMAFLANHGNRRSRGDDFNEDGAFTPQRMLDFDEGTTRFGRAGRK